MKKLCIYANCQGRGVSYFLSKTSFIERFEIRLHENYRIILNETSPDALMADAANCDVFLYQPMSAQKHGMLSTEEMIANVVPKSAMKLAWSYQFNHGFFPICKYGSWHTGNEVMYMAQNSIESKHLVSLYESDVLSFDCARRFAECLAEQARREETCDIKLVSWILQNFQTKHLFTMVNHPASELFVEIVRRILKAVDIPCGEIPILSANESCLPGYHAVHPAVVRELGLKYPIPQSDGADANFYRVLIEELQRTKGVI